MEKVKKVLDRIFIEGLSAMAHGLFATLIIGTQASLQQPLPEPVLVWQ
mgnify:CR=1 FL=1